MFGIGYRRDEKKIWLLVLDQLDSSFLDRKIAIQSRTFALIIKAT